MTSTVKVHYYYYYYRALPGILLHELIRLQVGYSQVTLYC